MRMTKPIICKVQKIYQKSDGMYVRQNKLLQCQNKNVFTLQ